MTAVTEGYCQKKRVSIVIFLRLIVLPAKPTVAFVKQSVNLTMSEKYGMVSPSELNLTPNGFLNMCVTLLSR